MEFEFVEKGRFSLRNVDCLWWGGRLFSLEACFYLSRFLILQPPGRVQTVLSGVEQTNPITVRVAQIGFAPEPPLIYRVSVKDVASALQLGDFFIQSFAL